MYILHELLQETNSSIHLASASHHQCGGLCAAHPPPPVGMQSVLDLIPNLHFPHPKSFPQVRTYRQTGPKIEAKITFWPSERAFFSSSILASILITFLHLFDSKIEPKSAQNQEKTGHKSKPRFLLPSCSFLAWFGEVRPSIRLRLRSRNACRAFSATTWNFIKIDSEITPKNLKKSQKSSNKTVWDFASFF